MAMAAEDMPFFRGCVVIVEEFFGLREMAFFYERDVNGR
jgi:hypothetical protein